MATFYVGGGGYYVGRKNDFTLGDGPAPSVTYKAGTGNVDGFCRAWEDAQSVAAFRACDDLQPMIFYCETQQAPPVWLPLPMGTEIALPLQAAAA